MVPFQTKGGRFLPWTDPRDIVMSSLFRNFRRHGVDMENGIDPKRTISLTWDDPWKKYEERWKKNPRGEGRPLLYSDISRTERPKRKKPKFKKLKAFKQWRENMETMSLIDQKIDDWLKE